MPPFSHPGSHSLLRHLHHPSSAVLLFTPTPPTPSILPHPSSRLLFRILHTPLLCIASTLLLVMLILRLVHLLFLIFIVSILVFFLLIVLLFRPSPLSSSSPALLPIPLTPFVHRLHLTHGFIPSSRHLPPCALASPPLICRIVLVCIHSSPRLIVLPPHAGFIKLPQ